MPVIVSPDNFNIMFDRLTKEAAASLKSLAELLCSKGSSAPKSINTADVIKALGVFANMDIGNEEVPEIMRSAIKELVEYLTEQARVIPEEERTEIGKCNILSTALGQVKAMPIIGSGAISEIGARPPAGEQITLSFVKEEVDRILDIHDEEEKYQQYQRLFEFYFNADRTKFIPFLLTCIQYLSNYYTRGSVLNQRLLEFTYRYIAIKNLHGDVANYLTRALFDPASDHKNLAYLFLNETISHSPPSPPEWWWKNVLSDHLVTSKSREVLQPVCYLDAMIAKNLGDMLFMFSDRTEFERNSGRIIGDLTRSILGGDQYHPVTSGLNALTKQWRSKKIPNKLTNLAVCLREIPALHEHVKLQKAFGKFITEFSKPPAIPVSPSKKTSAGYKPLPDLAIKLIEQDIQEKLAAVVGNPKGTIPFLLHLLKSSDRTPELEILCKLLAERSSGQALIQIIKSAANSSEPEGRLFAYQFCKRILTAPSLTVNLEDIAYNSLWQEAVSYFIDDLAVLNQVNIPEPPAIALTIASIKNLSFLRYNILPMLMGEEQLFEYLSNKVIEYMRNKNFAKINELGICAEKAQLIWKNKNRVFTKCLSGLEKDLKAAQELLENADALLLTHLANVICSDPGKYKNFSARLLRRFVTLGDGESLVNAKNLIEKTGILHNEDPSFADEESLLVLASANKDPDLKFLNFLLNECKLGPLQENFTKSSEKKTKVSAATPLQIVLMKYREAMKEEKYDQAKCYGSAAIAITKKLLEQNYDFAKMHPQDAFNLLQVILKDKFFFSTEVPYRLLEQSVRIFPLETFMKLLTIINDGDYTNTRAFSYVFNQMIDFINRNSVAIGDSFFSELTTQLEKCRTMYPKEFKEALRCLQFPKIEPLINCLSKESLLTAAEVFLSSESLDKKLVSSIIRTACYKSADIFQKGEVFSRLLSYMANPRNENAFIFLLQQLVGTFDSAQISQILDAPETNPEIRSLINGFITNTTDVFCLEAISNALKIKGLAGQSFSADKTLEELIDKRKSEVGVAPSATAPAFSGR